MPIEEVFRFLNVRPVQKVPDSKFKRRFAAHSEAKSPLHAAIEQISGAQAREQAVELARTRLAADRADIAAAPLVIAAADRASQESTVEKAKKEAEKKLGEKLGKYLQSNSVKALQEALWDRVYAHTLLPEVRPEDREVVFDAIRALHALKILAGQDENAPPLTRTDIAAIRPLIPRSVIPGSPMEDDGRRKQHEEEARGQLGAVHARIAEINEAIADVRNADRVHQANELRVVVDPQPPRREAGFTPLTRVVVREPQVSFREVAAPAVVRPANEAPENTPSTAVEETSVVVTKKQPWLFDDFGRTALSAKTMSLLAARKSEFDEQEIANVVARLEDEKYAVAAAYVRALPRDVLHVVRAEAKFADLLADVAIPGFGVSPVVDSRAPLPGSAAARGIQPLGIGDLLIVRQDLLRYVAGEVAHIENILKSESKMRMHSRMRETEETIITETERIEESEKDLQSTERFELHKESQKTIESEMSLEAGVAVTASYGPVSVTAHADFALSQSSSETNSTASTFAKDVTERSVSRIKQRAREERTRRTLERFEEKNEHGFDNKNGNGHVIGIYRWVDKHYKHRLINYGRRLMFEFIIPEPAAFYLFLQSDQVPAGVTMEKPNEPVVSGRALKPSDLTRTNYQDFISKYAVKDAEAYPAEVVYVSAAFAEAPAPGTAANTTYAKTSEKLAVPAGYKCRALWGQFNFQGYANKYASCFIAGQEWGSVTAANVEGVIPISINGWMTGFHVNVGIVCDLKAETKAAWQLRTYNAIMTAYERQLSEYNEQLTSAAIQAGVQIQGRNPVFNRKIERDELRKSVLRQLTNNFAQTRVSGVWRFNETFAAMQGNGQFGYPEANVSESIVEGRMIQFFEQAFEWQNITYRFYPYFWGRKQNWDDIFPLSDTDPQFIDFLRAGAARVVVPVHPAYNETVLHYVGTNEIWNGGSPPTIDDPLFVSIIDELKADSGAELDEEMPVCSTESGVPCQVDEWEVKLPTTLVYLQQDAKLPDFT